MFNGIQIDQAQNPNRESFRPVTAQSASAAAAASGTPGYYEARLSAAGFLNVLVSFILSSCISCIFQRFLCWR